MPLRAGKTNRVQNGMKNSGFLKRKTPIKKRGKRVLAWEKTRRALKVEFERAGIVTCEIHLEGCARNFNLSFAHAEKRRFITTQEQLEEVCLACVNCHNAIEKSSHEAMAIVVRGTIQNRETPVLLSK